MRKFIKIIATRCHRCTKFDSRRLSVCLSVRLCLDTVDESQRRRHDVTAAIAVDVVAVRVCPSVRFKLHLRDGRTRLSFRLLDGVWHIYNNTTIQHLIIIIIMQIAYYNKNVSALVGAKLSIVWDFCWTALYSELDSVGARQTLAPGNIYVMLLYVFM